MSTVPENTESEGGLGGGPASASAANATANASPPGTIRDTRLAERAFRQRWPITDEVRRQVVARLTTILNNRKASKREATAAARALIAADAQNQEQEKRDDGGDQVNVNVNANVTHTVTARIEQLTAVFAALADRTGGGDHAGDGVREPLDSRLDQGRGDAQTG